VAVMSRAAVLFLVAASHLACSRADVERKAPSAAPKVSASPAVAETSQPAATVAPAPTPDPPAAVVPEPRVATPTPTPRPAAPRGARPTRLRRQFLRFRARNLARHIRDRFAEHLRRIGELLRGATAGGAPIITVEIGSRARPEAPASCAAIRSAAKARRTNPAMGG